MPLREPGTAIREIRRAKDAGAAGPICYGVIGAAVLRDADRAWARTAECGLPDAAHVRWPGRKLRDERSSSLNVSFPLPLFIGFYFFAGGGILDRPIDDLSGRRRGMYSMVS